MKKILVFIATFVALSGMANPGDTVHVSSLTNAQLTWWGADDGWGIFPAASNQYRKILMDVTVGCATGGCSDWDYTVKIEGFHQTGVIDSTLTPFASFTVGGVVMDTFYCSYDTTYITSWNAISGSVDSIAGAVRQVLVYGDTNNYLVPTDTLYVWDANFNNDIYNSSGTVIGTSTVPYDTMLVATYIYRYVPFEVINKYELGRFMTPYGGYMADGQHGFNNSWKHVLTFDVTDYAQMFHDSVQIRAFYGGWSSGFSVTVNFRMIEGTPVREVIKMENIYQSGPGGWNSFDATVFETNYTYPKTVQIDNNAVGAMARIVPSGHGFVNSQNCAEFCNRDYYLKTDNVIRYTQAMWRDDCGLTPVYPQGGTWLYDRANWCPGAKTHSYDHDMTPYITAGSPLTVDLDLEIYNLTVPSGEVPPNYIIEGQFFQYGAIAATNDAEIVDIVSPSTTDAHGRKNPICGKPVITVRNNGSATLSSMQITYGIAGAATQTVAWNGSLVFGESETVELEAIADWNGTSNVFEVSLSNPNGMADEYPEDNTSSSTFEPVVTYVNDLVVEVSTNSQSFENEWGLYDMDGNLVAGNGLQGNYEVFSDTLDLEEGCYEFLLTDTGKDGLYWWANNDGYGEVRFFGAIDEDTIYQEFESDFGTEIRHQFRIFGEPTGVSSSKKWSSMSLFPNPTTGVYTLQSRLLKNTDATVVMYDLMGRVAFSTFVSQSNDQLVLDVSHLTSGLYVVELTTDEQTVKQRIHIVQ